MAFVYFLGFLVAALGAGAGYVFALLPWYAAVPWMVVIDGVLFAFCISVAINTSGTGGFAVSMIWVVFTFGVLASYIFMHAIHLQVTWVQ